MGNVTTDSPHPIAKPVRAPTSFPRAAVVIVALAAALVGSLALKQFAWLVGPVFLALVIVTLVHPLHRWLQRHKVPRLMALLGLVVSIYGLVIVLVAALFRGLISFGATMIFFLGLLLFMAIDSVGIDSRLEMLSAKRPGQQCASDLRPRYTEVPRRNRHLRVAYRICRHSSALVARYPLGGAVGTTGGSLQLHPVRRFCHWARTASVARAA